MLFPVAGFSMTFIINKVDLVSSPGSAVLSVTGNSTGNGGSSISNTQSIIVPAPVTPSVVKAVVINAFQQQLDIERAQTATPTPQTAIATFTVN